MQMCSLLRTIVYGIKAVPLIILAAMRIGFRDSKDFDILIKIHEYANEMIFIYSHDINKFV